MEIRCPTCATQIPARDVNVARVVAKCEGCDILFDCSDQLPEARTGSAVRHQRARAQVPLPKGLRMHVEGAGATTLDAGYRSEAAIVEGTLTIERVWRATAPAAWAMIPFAIAWWSFLVFWYSMAIGEGVWLMVIFPIGHVAAGVWMIYFILTRLLNTTWIRVDAEALSIEHGPIPARGNKVLAVASLAQIYVKKKTTKSNKGGTSHNYSVQAQTQDGWGIELLSGLEDDEQALFIEQQIELHLGIVDVSVPGEHGPS